jgi:GT2 family glycosyltransferase
VPLFIKREDFYSLGGYDENFFIGEEDKDFTLKILSSGKKIKICKVNITHMGGMSTVLLCHPNKKELMHGIYAG